MQQPLKLRDIVIAMTASTVSPPLSGRMKEIHFAPAADFDLLRAAVTAAEAHGMMPHVGSIYLSDVFFDERPDLNEIMIRPGILAVEIEAAELYTVAAHHDVRALAVLIISDHLLTDATLSAKDRARSFAEMVEILLAAAFA